METELRRQLTLSRKVTEYVLGTQFIIVVLLWCLYVGKVIPFLTVALDLASIPVILSTRLVIHHYTPCLSYWMRINNWVLLVHFILFIVMGCRFLDSPSITPRYFALLATWILSFLYCFFQFVVAVSLLNMKGQSHDLRKLLRLTRGSKSNLILQSYISSVTAGAA